MAVLFLNVQQDVLIDEPKALFTIFHYRTRVEDAIFLKITFWLRWLVVEDGFLTLVRSTGFLNHIILREVDPKF